MEIEIVYQTWDDALPIRLSLSPQEYFDPVNPGETYEADAIPRFNHTWQYLDVPRSRLKWSMERRNGTSDDTTFRAQYTDQGKSWMNHRIDPDGYEETIHYTQLTDRSYHLLRTAKVKGGWSVHTNSVIEDLEDGTESVRDFRSPWSWDEAIAFSNLELR